MTEDEARHLLGVAPGATREDLRRAYRDLIKVWHPDRFEGDARLRERAQASVRRLNEAYALLQGLPTAEATEPTLPPTSSLAAVPSRSAWYRRMWPRSRRARLLVGAGAAAGVGVLIAALAATLLRPARPQARQPATDLELPSPPPTDPPVTSTREPRTPSAPPVPDDPLRPISGAELIAPGSTGRSSLVVYNLGRHDAVLVLLRGNTQEHAVYVRAGGKVQLLNVAPGVYRVRAATGLRWRADRFTTDAAFLELERTVEFREQDAGTDLEFTRMTLNVGEAGDGSGFRTARPFALGK